MLVFVIRLFWPDCLEIKSVLAFCAWKCWLLGGRAKQTSCSADVENVERRIWSD